MAQHSTVRTLLAVSILVPGCDNASKECADGYVWEESSACEPLASSGETGITTDSESSGTMDSGIQQSDSGASNDEARFVLGEVVECSTPQPTVGFTDHAEAWGVTGPSFIRPEHAENGAVAVADFDLDGDLDIILAYMMEPAVLYSREGAGFIKSFLPGQAGITQLGMADIDSDGRLDLLTGGYDPEVILNRPDRWIHLPFPASPLGDETSVTKSIHPMDIDRDGHQDAYVLMTARTVDGTQGLDTIAWGNGDGTFVLDTSIVPREWGPQKGFDAQWFDWDGDGWQDVYVVNEMPARGLMAPDTGEGNFFLRNNEGTLEIANDACLCNVHHDGMGASVGDYNGDGRPDLYVTASGKNVLLEQLTNGTYVDVGQSTGADTLDGSLQSMAWGGVMVDIDNDGLLDVAVAEGDLWHEFSDDPYIAEMAFNVKRQVASGQFELANELGFGQMGSWRTVVPADHNDDGILDYVVADVEKRPLLLLSDGCTANAWLQVAAPHGSRIELDAGGRTRTAWANTASSFGGVVEPVAHFGLGETTHVTEVRVHLPDGESLKLVDTIQARRRITVH